MRALKRIVILCVIIFASNFTLAQTAIDPPEIIAEGTQFYCPQSKISVVTDFNIVSEEEIKEFFVQISSGYAFGSDYLELSGTHPNISFSFNATTAKLTLTSANGGSISLEDLIEAVKDIRYFSTNENTQGEKFFSFTLGNANFLPSTGHYYEYVEDIGTTWTLARTHAEERDYYGLPGYLATITSAEEAQLSGEQAEGAGWIGGSDAEEEGTWKWVTGPEAGTIFWIGLANGSAPNGEFEFWNTGEPNQAGDEDYAHITAPNVGIPGSWNDLSVTGAASGDYQPKGFIVEYGYDGPEDAPIFSAFTKVYTNAVDSVFSSSRCGPGTIDLRATLTEFEDQADATEVVWFDSLESDVAIWTGETYSPELTESKDYYVLASQDECFNGQRKRVTATIYEIPDIVKEVTLKNCDADSIPNDGFTDFNLEEASDLINNGDLTLTISYFLTEQNARDDINSIDPPFFNNIDADYVFARAESLDNCFDIAKVNLIVSATNPLDVLALLEECDEDDINDGIFTFDLTDASVIILESLPQQNLDIQYYRNQEDAALKINEILPQTSYTNETAYEERLFARIESLENGECVSVGEYVQLKVNPLPEFEVPNEAVYCQNIGPTSLSVSEAQGVYSYEWKDATGLIISTSETVEISSGGTYTVTAISGLNCRSKERVIAVKESSIAQISQDDIKVVDGEEQNSILIDPTNLGIGVYEYALDNSAGPYQKEPFFDNVLPGIHTLYIRDQNGCGIEQIEVYVIGYMKFFTPNGDGYNDTWKVLGVTSQPMSNIYVYDKFGKLLAELDASDEEGWDGLFNGKQLPSSDYWYRVQLEDGRIHTGHFSLIRR